MAKYNNQIHSSHGFKTVNLSIRVERHHFFFQGLHLATYFSLLENLLAKIEAGEIDPSFVVTHPASLEDAPELYKKFRDKKDGVIKVVLRPGQ